MQPLVSVRVSTPSPPAVRSAQQQARETGSPQQQPAPLRKRARVTVRISDGTGDSQCAATEYGGFSPVASAARKLSQAARAAVLTFQPVTVLSPAARADELTSQPVAVLSSPNAVASSQPVF